MTNLCKERVHEQIQASTEYLVTHENRDIQVTDSQSTRIPCSIWPFSSDCKAKADEIHDKNYREESPL